jgi:hypothetical protein
MSGTSRTHLDKILLVDGDFRSSQRLATLLGEDGYDVAWGEARCPTS